MDPQVQRILIEELIELGPVFIRMIVGLFDGEDPIDVLARERVEDIMPEILAEKALKARMVAEAIQKMGK